jgi:hypothetical protein
MEDSLTKSRYSGPNFNNHGKFCVIFWSRKEDNLLRVMAGMLGSWQEA